MQKFKTFPFAEYQPATISNETIQFEFESTNDSSIRAIFRWKPQGNEYIL